MTPNLIWIRGIFYIESAHGQLVVARRSPLSRSRAVSGPVAQLAETRQWFSFCPATRSARDWVLTFLLPQSADSAATTSMGRWSLCFGLAPSSPHWRSCRHGTPTLAGEHSVWHRAFRRHEPARRPGWRDARSQALSPLSEPAAKERLIRRDMESVRSWSCRPLFILLCPCQDGHACEP